MELNQAELEEWVAHPATQKLMRALQRRQQDLQDRWAQGHFLSENPYVSQGMNSKAVGAFEVYEDILHHLDEVLSDGN